MPHRLPALLSLLAACVAGDTDGPWIEEGPPPTPNLCRVTLACEGEIRDDPKVPCQLRVEAPDGSSDYDGWAGVELRGRSSLSFPKSQYAVELWADASGWDNVSDNLLDMGGEDDWILAGNYVDRALYRNTLAFDLFRALGGRWAPETALCDLVLDGEWLGIYTWGERIEVDDDRLDLEERGDGATFLVETEDDGSGFMDASTVYGRWKMLYPPEDEREAGAVARVTEQLEAMDAAVWSADRDAVWEHLDLDAAVDFVVVQELTRNNDAYFLSVHLYADPSRGIGLVPWDLDLSFGYPYPKCDHEDWLPYKTALFEEMAGSPAFQARLEARWAELRGGVLATDEVLGRMEGHRQTMEPVLEDNFEVWPFEDIDFCWGGDCYLCPVDGWEEEQERIQAWTVDRLAWMDEHIHDFD